MPHTQHTIFTFERHVYTLTREDAVGRPPVGIGVTLEDHVGEFLSCDLHPERTRGLEYAQPIGLLHIRNHSV